MGDVEGILCGTCKATFDGKNYINNRDDYYRPQINSSSYDIFHHPNYHDLMTSKDDGCFICTWLWADLPLMENGIQPLTVEGFQIYCRIESGRLSQTREVCFYVKCPWATDFELDLYMAKVTETQESDYDALPWSDLESRPWTVQAPDLGSIQDFKTIQGWISHCEKNHAYCCPSTSAAGTFFPTRIIDVEDAELGVVHVRNGDEIVRKQDNDTYPVYWTLSHRWGNQNIIQLIKDTEYSLRQGITLDQLSRTFRDAMSLVRRLGYRYIWIDSICIFQDSIADWQHEASAMKDVYHHSFCNISAIGSSYDPSTRGLFGKRRLDSRLLYPFKLNVTMRNRYNSDIAEGPWMVWNDSRWDIEVEKAPLSSRGWVVQERFLSTRALHFTRNQIYGECLEAAFCTTDPKDALLNLGTKWRRGPRASDYKSSRLDLAQTKANLAARGQSYSDPNDEHSASTYHKQWGVLVSTYIACDLTKESDRFVAMAGIARTFGEVSGDTYLAGLWKRMIYTDILWKTDASQGVPARRNSSYAPSWSWVSVMGGRVQLNLPRGRYANLPIPLIKLVDARIESEPPGRDPTGLLRSAELDIECMLYYYRWAGGPSKKLSVYRDDQRQDCYFDTDHSSGNLRLDTSHLVERWGETNQIEGVCIPIIGIYEGYGGGHNDYLVLEHKTQQKYKRIGLLRGGGIGRWISEFSGARTNITLV